MTRGQWLTGQELIERWQIRDFEIFDFIKKGLRPYTKYGRPIYDPATAACKNRFSSRKEARLEALDEEKRNERLKSLIMYNPHHGDYLPPNSYKPKTETREERINRRTKELYQEKVLDLPLNAVKKNLSLPNNENDASRMMYEAKGYLFRISDVREFERKHMEIAARSKPSFNSVNDAIEALQSEILNSFSENLKVRKDTSTNHDNKPELMESNYFVLEGDYWKVGFMGKTTTIKNVKGMRYIAYLLNNPRQDIPILKLMNSIEGMGHDFDEEYDCIPDEQLAELGMNTGGKTHKKKSEEALREAKRLLYDLNEAKKTGIQMEIDEAQETYDKYMNDYLNASKQDNTDPQYEKERKRIQKLITTAIKKINMHHQELGQHLSATIKTGVSCSYIGQETPIDWNVKY